MNNSNYISYVRQTLDKLTLMESMAEESAELIKAALKTIRATKLNNNTTPISIEDAYANLVEEIEDILMICEVLELKLDETNTTNSLPMNNKHKRHVLDEIAHKAAKLSDIALTYEIQLETGSFDKQMISMKNTIKHILNLAAELDLKGFNIENNPKWERWANRLGYTK